MEQPNPPVKIGTVAVVLATPDENPGSVQRPVKQMTQKEAEQAIHWIDTFSDEREIRALEQAIQLGNPFPLQSVYEFRARSEREDTEFGDYVEDLLCQKAVKP